MAKALAALTLGLCITLFAIASAAADKKQPDWSQLTPAQQQILAPLANDWNTFDDHRRKKWLLTAKRYPAMKPEQQQRLQTRMQAWAKLTPEQRRVARENYKKLAKQPPDKREAVKKKLRERQKPETHTVPATPAQQSSGQAAPTVPPVGATR